jgi:Excalibur calcium-binding domain
VDWDARRDQHITWTRGGPRPRSSNGATVSARTFLLLALATSCDSFTTRSSRYWRPRRRYEDLCLAITVRRVHRDWLLSTTDSEWVKPGVKARLLAWTNQDLEHQALELARSRKWLSSSMRRKAEARARERFGRIAAQIGVELPAELLRADETSPRESAPIVERVRGALRVRRERKPLAWPRSERAAAVCAAALLGALAVLIGLTALPFEGPTGGAGSLYPKGSGGAEENVGVAETPAWPRHSETHATTLEVRAPGRTEALVFALAPWTPPAIVRDKDCSDFNNQRRAQRWFNKHHPHGDPSGLDSDHDGKACEGRPCPCSHHRPRRDRSDSTRDAIADERAGHDVAAQTVPSGSAATGTGGTLSVTVLPSPTPALAPAPALGGVTQTVRTVDQAAASAGATGGLTSGLDQTIGDAGQTVTGATGGLLGN